jgi:parallel beta-helix repeat protein
MRARLLGLAALAAALLAVTAAPASADPYDAQLQARPLNSQFLLTMPFLLGEVDLSTLGVSQAELATVGPQSSSAGDGPHTFIVDNDRAQCPNAAFTTIQSAVVASGPGDLIRVCPGLYQEQVDVGPGHGGLTLFSQQPRQAIIKAPAVMADPGDIVRIHGVQNVSVRQFVITGPLPDTLFCSLFTRTGVRIDQGASALLRDNQITQIKATDPALRGCQNGVAVLVGRNFEGTTGSAWITHNLVDHYQKGGIVVDNAGSHATIDHNSVIHGPEDIFMGIVIAPNGIQVSRGAAGEIDHNVVTENNGAASGTGVLIYQAGTGLVTVDHNDVYKNDDGISLYESDNESVSHNNSHEQLVYDGLFMDSASEGNTVDHNDAYLNFEHDCHDDSTGGGTAGTANYWLHDKGNTENRPGLCKSTNH